MTVKKFSSRTFSKWMLGVNVGLAWIAIFYAIFEHQAEAVVAASMGLIGVLFNGYIGVGHLDFRKAVEFSKAAITSDEEAPIVQDDKDEVG